MLATQASSKINHMNFEQHSFYNDLFHAINHHLPFTPFISGGASQGKSFVIEAALDLLRSKGFIAIATATSAFAAQIYPSGKTAHLVFKVCFQISRFCLTFNEPCFSLRFLLTNIANF